MAIPIPTRWLTQDAARAQRTMAQLALAAAATLLAAAALVPAPLILPVLSAVLVLMAGIVAALAWSVPPARNRPRLDHWDISGALAFLGFCAALLSEPEQVLPLLEAARRGE